MKKKGTTLKEIKISYSLQNTETIAKTKGIVKKIQIILINSIIVLFIFLMIWQILFSAILNQRSNNLKQSAFYKELMREIDSFTLLYNLTMIDFSNVNYTDVRLSPNDYDEADIYKLECKYSFPNEKLHSLILMQEFDSFSNACLEINSTNYKIITFDNECNRTIYLNSTIRIDTIMDKKFCYKSFPLSYFKYKFIKTDKDCLDDEILCGINTSFKFCLKKSNFIKNCPITNLELIELKNKASIQKDANFKNKFFVETKYFSSNNKKIDVIESDQINYKERLQFNLLAHNYTNEDSDKLSVSLIFQPSTYNKIPIPKNNSSDLLQIYSDYLENLVPNTTVNLNHKFPPVLPYISLEDPTSLMEFDVKINEILNVFKIYYLDEEFIKYNEIVTLDPSLNFRIGLHTVYFPRDHCIEKIYTKYGFNDDYLKSFTYLNFEFLDLLVPYYIIWTLSQAFLNLGYIFMYDVKILLKKINNKLTED